MSAATKRRGYCSDAGRVRARGGRAVDPGTDENEPGAAIAKALRGSREQESPGPICPHHTAAAPRSDGLGIRTLFVADADQEPTIRELIEAALTAGGAGGDETGPGHWRVRSSHRSILTTDELTRAYRLKSSR